VTDKIPKIRPARQILADEEKSAYRKYRDLTVGDASFLRFLLHEMFAFLLVPLPGAPGILFRRIFYKNYFKRCGKGLIVGRNCVFRHPTKISIGDNVTIDDLSLIDARGTEAQGIVLEDGVMINRNTSIQSKGGDITIEKSVTVGANSSLVSWSGIRIDEGTVLAGGCCLSAGKFDYGELGTSILEQEPFSSGPITIGKNSWIATRVTILDGVRIGEDSIIAAGAVVTGNIPPRTIASGNPAKVVFTRR
jgi:acetyltransferase-like isoleucine patch superfamily enzyme